MKKIPFPSELAYLLSLPLIALGIAFMAIADFGMSMVSAPAYLISLKLDFITFGQTEYCLQACLLILMCLIMGKFRLSYLFSFVTAFLYGCILDLFMLLCNNLPANALALRLFYFILGMMLVSLSVSLFFRTYLAPAVYELFVKELSSHFHLNINRFKIIFDWTFCLIAIVMSFIFFGFGKFQGIGVGSVFSGLFNGFIISWFNKLLERHFDFRDHWHWRKFFS